MKKGQKGTSSAAYFTSGDGWKALKAWLRKTRVIRRKLDCLKPSPQWRLERLSITASEPRDHRDAPWQQEGGQRSARWTVGNDLTQGDEQVAYVTLETSTTRKRGITYGAR